MEDVYRGIVSQVFGGKMPNNIEFINWLPTERHFADFLGDSDCFISPSRGESFNLPLLQAMSCGVPVITNADHAHADYVTKDNAFLVKNNGLITAQDGMFFRNDGRTNTGKWFDITVNDIAQSMIQAFNKGRHLNEGGIKTAEKYTWEAAANRIVNLHNGVCAAS
jgi:glycosyltransferase involved in cell wall biosynthesis